MQNTKHHFWPFSEGALPFRSAPRPLAEKAAITTSNNIITLNHYNAATPQ